MCFFYFFLFDVRIVLYIGIYLEVLVYYGRLLGVIFELENLSFSFNFVINFLKVWIVFLYLRDKWIVNGGFFLGIFSI